MTNSVLFGAERVVPGLDDNLKPITTEEAKTEVKRYSDFLSKFNSEMAARLPLSYLIVPIGFDNNFANLDRWYARDNGEQINGWMIYKVKLRN